MLHESDVRALVRLLGGVSILNEDLPQKKRCLLGGLCDLIGGDTWLWSLNRRVEKRRAICLESMSGGRPIALWSEHPPLCPPAQEPAFSGTDDFIAGQTERAQRTVVVRQIFEETISSIRIARQENREGFTPREIKMAQIVLAEIPWLHEPSPVAQVEQNLLSPQKRAVLVCLIDGLDRQAIAERLRLSPHTIHGYMKDLYRHYRVNSRSELMKQFALGGAEGTP